MKHWSDSQRGIVFFVLAMAFFAALDTTVKYVSAFIPIVTTLWMRYVFQTLISAGMLMPSRGRTLWRVKKLGLVFIRGALMAVSSALAFVSLSLMAVAEFSAIMMLTPMALALVSAMALKEHVSWQLWLLLAGALAGALMVVQPGHNSLVWVTVLPVILIVLNVAYQLLTAHLAVDVEPGTMHFYSGLFSMLLVSLALPWGWQWPPNWEIWAWVLLLSLFSAVGHYMMILAYSLAGPATLSPFLYFQLAFATLGGWLVFSHAPNAWAWLGMGLIALCGIASTRLPGPRSRWPVETEPQL
ncbi:MAG: DMT family transporter [Betaproteobacteria bacterium]|nr:DMT family transporter [Betaproteobacteria bacterium]